ncbi:MAG: metal-sensing transcriptional repressor [Lautropia sp.]
MSENLHIHESHPKVIARLRRAHGHLNGVIEMIERGRACLEVAQQLHAVEKAVSQAKRALIQDHLDHCLDAVARPLEPNQRHSVDEFKEITKYL